MARVSVGLTVLADDFVAEQLRRLLPDEVALYSTAIEFLPPRATRAVNESASAA